MNFLSFQRPQFVFQELRDEGFQEADDGVLGSEPKAYTRNRRTRDVLAFARSDKEAILMSRLVKEFLLVPQVRLILWFHAVESVQG